MTKENNGWISTKKAPKTHNYYLTAIQVTNGNDDSEFIVRTQYYSHLLGWEYHNTTHWQPLPPRPQD